jgi:putative hydrolase of the HAD superfamily
VRALFLDVGETLVYPHPSAAEITAGVCVEAGFPVAVERIEAAEATIGPRVLEKQRAATELYSVSMENSRRFWTWVYGELLHELQAPESLRPEIANRLHERFNTLETWRLYEDTIPVLEALQEHRRAGLAMGIISNWEDWLDSLLSHLDLDRYFDFAIISAGVQLEKPDPAIFHAALDKAGVAPGEAMHVGDSVHADVEGALGVGIHPVLLDRRGRYAERPDRLPEGATVIRSLTELAPLLG